MRPLTPSTTAPPSSVSSTVPGSRRCLWQKQPPRWSVDYEWITKQMEDAGLLNGNSPTTRVDQACHYDSPKDGDVKEHSALRSSNRGDVVPSSCEIFPHATDANSGDAIAGGSTLDGIPPSTSETADSFEISETPSATEQPRCPADPEVVRAMGKRLDTGSAGYLVLCWVYPHEGEAVASDSHRCFRDYDQKILRDAARRERLSALRPRKRSRSPESQGSSQTRKKPRSNGSVSTSQSQTYPSRQVEDHLFLDSDVSLDLELI